MVPFEPFVSQYNLFRATPFPTTGLGEFIERVAARTGIIGLDSNASINPRVRSVIQSKLLATIKEFQFLLKQDLLFLTQYYNQFYSLQQFSFLVIRFGRSRITETLAFDNDAVPLDERPYIIQYPFNISYIRTLKIIYPINFIGPRLSLRKCMDQYDFDRTAGKTPSYWLRYSPTFEELWISGFPFNGQYFGNIELEGLFNFFDPESSNISPNNILPDDFLYNVDELTLEGFEAIVAKKTSLAFRLDPDEQIDMAAANAYAKFEKAQGSSGIKIG